MIPESFWRLGSSHSVETKASWASFQTGKLGRKKTIISVDADEALVIEWAVKDYIEKHRMEVQELGARIVHCSAVGIMNLTAGKPVACLEILGIAVFNMRTKTGQ